MSKNINAADLNIDVQSGAEDALFKWFLASFLMGKRIQADIACNAYRVLVEKHHRDTPRKLANCTHRELVAMLGEAHYVRYDESTAHRLSSLSHRLVNEFGGKLSNVHEASENRPDFEKRLQSFDGVGPKTVEIFMREAGSVLY